MRAKIIDGTVTTIFIFFFGLNSILAQSSDFPQPLRYSEEIFPNPFLVDRSYSIKSIVEVEANKHIVGYIDNPENISIHFSVKGDQSDIPNLPEDRFRYQILKKSGKKLRYYIVPAATYYRGDGYFARLQMPRVDFEGEYDLLITVYGNKKKSIQITRNLPNFFRYQQRKVDVIFLIDNSGSMNRNDPHHLRYQEIYRVFRNSEFASKIDELAVISFSDNPQLLFPFGKVKEFLKKKIIQTSLRGRGNTDFSKPFRLAERLIRGQGQDQDQKAVIFLTDGVATHPYADEHLRLRNLGIPIYTVGLSVNKQSKEYRSSFLKKIAQQTQGEFFEAEPDVIGEVFKKFIDLSTASVREFVVIPLKKRYTYNELIHIDYRSSKAYEKNLKVSGYFVYPDHQESAEVYQKKPGRMTLYPPSLDALEMNPSEGKKEKRIEEKILQKIGVRVKFFWRGKMLFDEITDIEIGEDSIQLGLIYFQKVDPLNYDVRYFLMKNLTQDNLFVNIVLHQIGSSEENSVNPMLSFKESPFLLASKEERLQSVVFYPQKPIIAQKKKEKDENQVINIVLQTSRGDFLNQIYFDYLSQIKKTASFSLEVENRSKNHFFISFFGIGTIIFFSLLILRVLKIIKKKKINKSN